jgi:phosphoribosyl 1,2-cyclic phosphodiesterase
MTGGARALRVALLASGSAGNVTLIDAGGDRILVDAGLPADTIERALDPLGVPPRSICAILLTHEHDDHARGAGAFARTTGVPVFANGATISAAEHALGDAMVRRFETGRPFEIGPFGVTAFPVPHDAAEPVAFSIHVGGRRIVVATDLGSADEILDAHIAEADLIVLESNYDVGLLHVSGYPWFLKNRILSGRGHLSNDDAARALARASSRPRSSRPRTICLAHLSEVNNLAALARDTVRDALTHAGRAADPVLAVRPNGRSDPIVLD